MTVSNSATELIFISSILHTLTHRCMHMHKHRHSPICSVLGVHFVIAVQNGMIDVKVIGGHMTAPSGMGAYWCVCVHLGTQTVVHEYVCGSVLLYFYLFEDWLAF